MPLILPDTVGDLPCGNLKRGENLDSDLSDSIRGLEVECDKLPTNGEILSIPCKSSAVTREDSTVISSGHSNGDIHEDQINSHETRPLKRQKSETCLHQTLLKSPVASSSCAPRSARRSRCALVIDDSKTIRKVMHRALQNFGFHVIQAENGLQGLEEMKSTVFDIVLCDFLMPIMDGMDCVQQYRQWENNNRSWFRQVCATLASSYFVSCFLIL